MSNKPNKLYPLLESQMGVVLECIKHPDARHYNNPFLCPLSKVIKYERVSKAWNAIIQSHKEWRTRFIFNDGEPLQYIDDTLPVPMKHTFMSEAELAVYKNEFASHPFDLFSGEPLLKAEYVETELSCYLLLNFHHSIYDGNTFTIFGLNDMHTAYAKKPMQSCDYGMCEHAVTEKAWIATAGYEAARKHYAQRFAAVNFVTLAECATSPVGGLAYVKSCLPQSEVDTWCHQQAVQSNLLFQAAFTLVLSRLSRETTPGYYTVSHGRNDARLADAYGMFAQSIPVAIGATPTKSVREIIGEVLLEHKETVRHGVYPFAHFCRDNSVEPHICFAFQGKHLIEQLVLDGVTYELEQIRPNTTSEDITCVVYMKSGNYEVRVWASDALYTKDTLRAFAHAVTNTVKQMMLNPDAQLKDIKIVSAQEERQLISLSCDGNLDFACTKTLVDLFGEQAERTPDNVCLVFKDKSYTYREMDEITDRLAVVLQREYSVKPETIVGVMVDRSELLMLYPMAIMKAGGAYMPLDYHFPTDRLQFICQDADVRLILSEGDRVAEAMSEYDGKVITCDIIDTLNSVEGELDPALKAGPGNMFAIMYTSGSTGVPKGVVLEHHNIVNFVHWYVKEFDVTAADHVVAYSNFGFDAHMIDLYPAISVGASVYIISSEMRMDLMAMNQYMEENSLSLAFMTTQVGYMFATTLKNKSLRLLSVGGEKLMSLKQPPFRLYNVYGPTECSLYSTFFNIKRNFDGIRSCIGRPLDNYRLYVVDETMNFVPHGVPGELLVAGAGVARGYLNRPELTEEKFVTFRGEKAYRTGDLVRWGDDRNIEFIGRIDGQVKLRGLRIEPGEIEAVLSTHPGIKSCSVAVKEQFGTQHLCAYYTAEGTIDINSLRSHLAHQLTDYMVPTAFKQLDEIPLTPNGKVNVKALPVPEIETDEIVLPVTDKEKELYYLACELLGTDGIGVCTNLFAYGMTSLLSMVFVAEAKKRGVNIKVSDLYLHKNIRDTLSHEMSMIAWHDGCDENKPIAVLLHGATYGYEMNDYLDALSKRFSILSIEPLVEHYFYTFKDANMTEIIETYYTLVASHLPEGAKVAMITGHCTGGELAYRLANRWYDATGDTPLLALLDVFWKDETYVPANRLDMALLPQDILKKHGAAIKQWEDALSMLDRIQPLDQPRHYAGDVVMFCSLKGELLDPLYQIVASALPEWGNAEAKAKASQNCHNYWSEHFADMTIIDVDADHLSMLCEPYVSIYMEWLDHYFHTQHHLANIAH